MTIDEIKNCLGSDFPAWQSIRDKFVVGTDGRYFNARMRHEMERRRAYVASRKRNATKPTVVSNDDHVPEHMQSDTVLDMREHMLQHVSEHMGNGNGNQNGTGISEESDQDSGLQFQSAAYIIKWLSSKTA
jgi:hypothetical protein